MIHNPEKEYGLSNIKTAKLFKNNGLNYRNWLDYNKEKPFTLLARTEYTNSKINIPKDLEKKSWKRFIPRQHSRSMYCS